MDTRIDFAEFCESRFGLLTRVGPRAHQLLQDGQLLAHRLSPLLERFLSSLSLDSIPECHRNRMVEDCRLLLLFGFYLYCLLYDFPTRMAYDTVDESELWSAWIAQSLTANSVLRQADKFNDGYPSRIFQGLYDSMQYEQTQRKLGIGWWKRLTNKNRFKNFFASGLLFGMLYDDATKLEKLAKEGAGIEAKVTQKN